MKYIYSTFLVAAITLTSCKNNDTEKTQVDPRTVVPFTQQTLTAMQNQSSETTTSQNHNLFHENNAASTPSVAAGVNPAHGQPNHRCDIAVGAPLNTAVNGATPSQQTNLQTTQLAQSSQVATSKVVTPKGMNPPHGEKNHRCDIAVGAPLNSKPAATTSVKSTATSGEVSQKINVENNPVPALLATTSANTVTVEGMNPPHGQDGHRCDISVGAPLPKD